MNFKVDISVCRVCMKSENGISLFKDRSLHEKFVYTTKLMVKEQDSMPAILCGKCIARLKIAYEFCRLANSSEKHLRKFINKISSDFQEVTKTLPQDEYAVMEEDDSDINALIDEAGGFEEIGDPPRQLKEESMTATEELEVIEVPEESAATKQEVFEHEIYMEEFHEIIQEDNCDTNLYLDENSTEELHLYEDGNEYFDDVGGVEQEEEEEEEEEEQSNAAEQPEMLSSIEDNEVKEPQKEEKKPGRKRNSRSARRANGETAAAKLEGKSNICIKCNKDFSTKTNLMRHMSTHDGVKPYQCTTCGKGFTQNGSLKQHMFIHTGERPHVCNVCQRGFTQSKSLIFHMRRHTGEKPFTCDECGISFRQKDGLKHHVLKYHSGAPSTPDRHVCCVCDRVLASKYSLGVHMRKHAARTEDKKSDQDYEPESTTSSSKDDLNTQTSTAPAVTSTAASQSETSTEIPSGTVLQPTTGNAGAGLRMKQFQCGKCFKSFHIKRNLLRHLRNHDVSSLELHECADCKIGFDTKRSLKLHRQRDHKDVIPDLNNCEYCNAPYVTVADLSEHIANVHDAIDQDCPHCNEHFKSQKLYYDHLLEHEHMLED